MRFSILTLMAAFVCLLTGTSQTLANWENTKFGRLPLNKPLILNGTLSKGWLNTRKLPVSIKVNPELMGDAALDSYYRHHHLITFTLGSLTCEGVAALVTMDEYSRKISYAIIVYYDRNQRLEGCPYHLQVYLGPMSEEAGNVYVEAAMYWTFDVKEDIYSGKLFKN